MSKKFDPADMRELVSEDRLETLDPQRIMSLIPFLTDSVVADIGCGPGFFTLPMAKYLFEGKVYAVDVQQEMLDEVSKQTADIHLTNVEVLLSEESSLPLETGLLDGALAAFVVHEADNPAELLQEVMRTLRSGGWLAVLEWHKREMDAGPPVEARIDEGELRDLAARAGFRMTSRYDLNDQQYMLLLRK